MAVTRYQTNEDSQRPGVPMGRAVGPRYQNTALTLSGDAGRTWSPLKLLTGLAQQTAAVLEASQPRAIEPLERRSADFIRNSLYKI